MTVRARAPAQARATVTVRARAPAQARATVTMRARVTVTVRARVTVTVRARAPARGAPTIHESPSQAASCIVGVGLAPTLEHHPLPKARAYGETPAPPFGRDKSGPYGLLPISLFEMYCPLPPPWNTAHTS